MQWHCLVTALACASLHVHSTPCSWVQVKNAWTTGFMAVVNIQMEETVDHWSVGIEFSQSIDSFESWKGLVTETSDKNFTIRNHCYNSMIYSCQCFQLTYVARHQLYWERNTTVRFNGQLTSSCFQDPCIDFGVSTPTPTSSTGILPQDAIVRVRATVQAISEGLQNMSNNRYKRNTNIFTEDENKLLERLTNLTIYLNKECTNESGKCESNNIERFQRELETSFRNIKETKTISPGFQQTFEESKKTFDEIAAAAEEEQRKPATPTMITARTTTPSTIPQSKTCPLKSELVARKQTSLLNKFIQKNKAEVCSSPPTKNHGTWWCSDDDKSCYLKCDPGYASLFTSTSCIDGVWTDLDKMECEPSVFLMIGGEGVDMHARVEIYHPSIENITCFNHPPQLDKKWAGSTAFLHNGVTYVCGGRYTRDLCTSLNMRDQSGQWKTHDISNRERHSAVVMKDKLYFIGGVPNGDSVLWTTLPLENKPIFTPVPNLSYRSFGQCVVKISEDAFIVTGGRSSKDVIKYNVTTQTSTSLPPLQEERGYHGCVMVEEGDKQWIVVAGGWNAHFEYDYNDYYDDYDDYDSGGYIIDTTERFDLNGGTKWESLGQLNVPRYLFKMSEAENGIIVMGGYNGGDVSLDSVELLNLTTQEWTFVEPNLKNKRFGFDKVEVTSSVFNCNIPYVSDCSIPVKKDKGKWYCNENNNYCYLKCNPDYTTLFSSTTCSDGSWTELDKMECLPSVFLSIGGSDRYLNDVEFYDPNWKNVTCSNLPPGYNNLFDAAPSTFVHNGLLYACSYDLLHSNECKTLNITDQSGQTTVTQTGTTAASSEVNLQALNNLQDTVRDIFNDLGNLVAGRRIKRNENGLSDEETKLLEMSNSREDELGNLRRRSKRNSYIDEEKELLEVMTNLITYMNNNCVPTTGICQASWINYYINQLKTIFNKIKAIAPSRTGLTPGYYNAFETKHNSYKESIVSAIATQTTTEAAEPSGQWKNLKIFNYDGYYRTGFSSVAMQSKVYFIGGQIVNNELNNDLSNLGGLLDVFGGLGRFKRNAPIAENVWTTLPLLWNNQHLTMVPNLTYSGLGQCIVKIDEDYFVITGGGNKTEVIKYNVTGKRSTALPQLKEARYQHGCVMVEKDGKQWIVVAGGEDNPTSTERLDLNGGTQWESLGQLNHGRSEFKMVETQNGIIVMGGGVTIEILNWDTHQWKTTQESLKNVQYPSSLVEIPASVFTCDIAVETVCSSPPTKNHGTWWCSGDDKSCYLKCDPGYASLFTSTSCIDGVWTDFEKMKCEPLVLLLIGGRDVDLNASVEIYHPSIENITCANHPPQLDKQWFYSATFVHNCVVYVCGGWHTKDLCTSLNMTDQSAQWKTHNISSVGRRRHSAVVMQDNLYFIGGWPYSDNVWTTLPLENEPTFTPVPNLSYRSSGQCVVKISEDSFIVTGGALSGAANEDVTKYNVTTQTSIVLPPLQEERYDHGCALVEDSGKQWIVVAGGRSNRTRLYLDTTERLDLNGGTRWESLGQLNVPRRYFQMSETENGILAMGGYQRPVGSLDMVELLNLTTLEWQHVDSNLMTKRNAFDNVEVAASIFDCNVPNSSDVSTFTTIATTNTMPTSASQSVKPLCPYDIFEAGITLCQIWELLKDINTFIISQKQNSTQKRSLTTAENKLIDAVINSTEETLNCCTNDTACNEGVLKQNYNIMKESYVILQSEAPTILMQSQWDSEYSKYQSMQAQCKSVSCGGHFATDCSKCPKENGANWCHGDCAWINETCVPGFPFCSTEKHLDNDCLCGQDTCYKGDICSEDSCIRSNDTVCSLENSEGKRKRSDSEDKDELFFQLVDMAHNGTSATRDDLKNNQEAIRKLLKDCDIVNLLDGTIHGKSFGWRVENETCAACQHKIIKSKGSPFCSYKKHLPSRCRCGQEICEKGDTCEQDSCYRNEKEVCTVGNFEGKMTRRKRNDMDQDEVYFKLVDNEYNGINATLEDMKDVNLEKVKLLLKDCDIVNLHDGNIQGEALNWKIENKTCSTCQYKIVKSEGRQFCTPKKHIDEPCLCGIDICNIGESCTEESCKKAPVCPIEHQNVTLQRRTRKTSSNNSDEVYFKLVDNEYNGINATIDDLKDDNLEKVKELLKVCDIVNLQDGKIHGESYDWKVENKTCQSCKHKIVKSEGTQFCTSEKHIDEPCLCGIVICNMGDTCIEDNCKRAPVCPIEQNPAKPMASIEQQNKTLQGRNGQKRKNMSDEVYFKLVDNEYNGYNATIDDLKDDNLEKVKKLLEVCDIVNLHDGKIYGEGYGWKVVNKSCQSCKHKIVKSSGIKFCIHEKFVDKQCRCGRDICNIGDSCGKASCEISTVCPIGYQNKTSHSFFNITSRRWNEQTRGNNSNKLEFRLLPLDGNGIMATAQEVEQNMEQIRELLNQCDIVKVDGGFIEGTGYNENNENHTVPTIHINGRIRRSGGNHSDGNSTATSKVVKDPGAPSEEYNKNIADKCCFILTPIGKNKTIYILTNHSSLMSFPNKSCPVDEGGGCIYTPFEELYYPYTYSNASKICLNKIENYTCCSQETGALCNKYGNATKSNIKNGTCSSFCAKIANCSSDPGNAWCTNELFMEEETSQTTKEVGRRIFSATTLSMPTSSAPSSDSSSSVHVPDNCEIIPHTIPVKQSARFYPGALPQQPFTVAKGAKRSFGGCKYWGFWQYTCTQAYNYPHHHHTLNYYKMNKKCHYFKHGCCYQLQPHCMEYTCPDRNKGKDKVCRGK